MLVPVRIRPTRLTDTSLRLAAPADIVSDPHAPELAAMGISCVQPVCQWAAVTPQNPNTRSRIDIPGPSRCDAVLSPVVRLRVVRPGLSSTHLVSQ